jgi:hypothetical protein
VIATVIQINELSQADRNISHLLAAAVAQPMRHVLRYILRPLLHGVESHDADRVLVLAGEQIGDHGFQIGIFNIGFPIGPAIAAKVVNDKVRF